jgi:diguanylate cyclase (GGDEF)-like protein/PAS domain S-box-containing protein
LFTWRRLEQTARSLAAEREKGRATLHAIADAVITTDRDGHVTFANPLAERMTGHSGVELHGMRIGDIVQFATLRDREQMQSVVEHCMRSGATASLIGRLSIRSTQGEAFEVRVSASPVRLPGGEFDGVVVALTDITESVAMTEKMAHQATHDGLTELPNRALLLERLKHALGVARRTQTLVAVLFIDLDDFKRVNDGFGHAIGDAALRAAGQRLLLATRANDMVARWGGDEFLVVAEELVSVDAAAVVARKLLEALEGPIEALGHEIFVSASVGISVFPRDGLDPEILVQNADRAMYRAKQQGRNQAQFFSEAINQRAAERREIEAGLRLALTREELQLHFQPQVSLDGRTFVGAEVLVRWRHPQSGLIEPARFISVAEDSGLIHDIGAWVLRTACLRASHWSRAGLPLAKLSVNVSPRQFLRADLLRMLRESLDESGLAAHQLVIEVTEGAVTHDVDAIASALHELRALGVGIAVDDFGTGYSSLSFLRRFPVTQIKIDRSFIRNVMSSSSDAAITRGVIGMAKGMGIEVIAEGVESAEQLAFLRAHGCDAVQGFFVSHPLAEPEFVAALRHSLRSREAIAVSPPLEDGGSATRH